MKCKQGLLRVFIGILLFSTTIQAETEKENVETKRSENIQTKKEPKAQPSSKRKVLKEFTPSEEISVDKPVAFPADI